ncbi:MAG: YicC/YloC family endoribonuclease, partial [Eubacterium sp.]
MWKTIGTLQEENEDYEWVWQKLEPVLEDALNQVNESRSREGKALRDDVASRCVAIKDAVKSIESKSPDMLAKYQEELRAKIEIYAEPLEIDEKRVLT